MKTQELFVTTSLDTDIVYELLPEFIDEIQNEFDKLLENFNNNRLPNVMEIAHKMNGASKSFGAFRIEQKTANIISTIKEKNGLLLIEAIESLKAEIGLLNKAYAK